MRRGEFFDAISFYDGVAPPTLWQRLRGKEPQIPAALLDECECMEVGLDKAWHGSIYVALRSRLIRQ